MINRRTLFEIYRLKDMQFSIRQIAKTLNLDRGTVARYIKRPDITSKPRLGRPSKIDPFREDIKEMVAGADSAFPAAVIVAGGVYRILRPGSFHLFIILSAAPILFPWQHVGNHCCFDWQLPCSVCWPFWLLLNSRFGWLVSIQLSRTVFLY